MCIHMMKESDQVAEKRLSSHHWREQEVEINNKKMLQHEKNVIYNVRLEQLLEPSDSAEKQRSV